MRSMWNRYLTLLLALQLPSTVAYVAPGIGRREAVAAEVVGSPVEAPELETHSGRSGSVATAVASFGVGCWLGLSRRRFLAASLAAAGALPPAMARAIGRSEERTEMKMVDINNASVTEYQQFKGLYPSGAAIISGNGPYTKVEDVYNLRGIKDNDIMKAIVKKYEPYLECRVYTPRKASRMLYKEAN